MRSSPRGSTSNRSRLRRRLLKRLLEQGVASGQISAVSKACVRFAEDAATQDAGDEAIAVLEAAHKAFAESGRRARAAFLASRAAAADARTNQQKYRLARRKPRKRSQG